MKETTEPTITEHGDETHPAWVLIGASRSQGSGRHLFDSDVEHRNTVTIRLRTASRKRSLKSDWLHGGKKLFEVELSEAQWASFVSSMNSGSGTPGTLRYTREDGMIDEFPHSSRLALTVSETHAAAEQAFKGIEDEFDASENILLSGTMKQKRDALRDLRSAIHNATPNVDFAGKQLIEQTEDIVQKAKADVEAFVAQKAHQLGIDPGEIHALTSGEEV